MKRSRNFMAREISGLASVAFRDWIYKHRKSEDKDVTKAALRGLRTVSDEITGWVCEVFGVYRDPMLTGRRGVAENNIIRWVVMYLCSDIGGHKSSHIAEHLGLERIVSISNTIAKLNTHMEEDKKARTEAKIKSGYDTRPLCTYAGGDGKVFCAACKTD
jgi:hypothetical protein